jgi:hypothetical protein
MSEEEEEVQAFLEKLDGDDEDEEGVYVLVKLLESDLGIGLSVPNDEPNADYFMSVVDNLYRTATVQAIENLIKSCERNERGVLAKEIRAFLETPKTLH